MWTFLAQILRSLMTSPDNTISAHYIFMDNEFFLPTVTGVPLRIALSGTFTPGFKGGLQIARDMVIICGCGNKMLITFSQHQLKSCCLNLSTVFTYRAQRHSCHLVALSLSLKLDPTSLNMSILD